MNSVLNPEAPEFYPHLTTIAQVQLATYSPWSTESDDEWEWDGYTSLNKSIRSSNTLPSGTSHNLFKTFTDFNVVTCQLSENVVIQSNQILATELPAVKLKCNDQEFNTEKIVDANDSMLDRININIDTETGVNQPKDSYLGANQIKITNSSWNNTPVIAKIQVGSATFIGAKNIPRPQLNFKDTIDNSDSLWVPKISDKPNSVKPLALNILYNDDGEAVGFEHPYKVELDLYHPPSQFIDPSEPPSFPAPLADTPLTYVDTEPKLDALIDHLSRVKELAIDLEHHSYRTYQGITCLIQISTNEGGDFIIDTLAIREHIHKLNLAFTDPKKLKVLHGAECDVIWLQRDFGVYIVGMFDTHQAARALNLHGLSLKYLLMKYCRVDAEKKYQLADWRMRPLPSELIDYARSDTHYLLYIWRLMKADLLNKGSSQPQLLLSVFEQSRHICGATYNKEVITDISHVPLYVRSKKSFNSQQMSALKMLYKWRDSQARALDESTTYLLPNHMLLSLAETLPREVQGVNACCSPMPPFVKQNLITIHRMLLSCRELPNEPQLYQMPTSIRTMVNATIQPLARYEVHDYAYLPEFSDENEPKIDQAAILLEDSKNFQPDIKVFAPVSNKKTYGTIISDLNVDAQLFIPPYDRYRKYRSLAQMEEIKEFKEKEAKIAALGKGNELIKTEVLVKLQQAKTQIENEEKTNVETLSTDVFIIEGDGDSSKKTQRKRKISNEKGELKGSVEILTETKKKELNTNPKKIEGNVKPFTYKNVDYKKFYNNSNKEHKQKHHKMEFKKYKK